MIFVLKGEVLYIDIDGASSISISFHYPSDQFGPSQKVKKEATVP